ncbi:MAG: redoxin domain-containing protein [Candidatus Gracilibacteria bacterium]|nr:redoxin domain-containing protein [Candidatus Gracilibacteria bacterium]
MEDFTAYTIAKIDTEAPSFKAPYYDPKTDSDSVISSEDLKGKWYILFFYPADFTFVCPTEMKDMAEQEAKFKEMGVEVLSVSTDSVFSHKAWIKEERLMQGFPYKMIADKNLEMSDVYNVLDEESGMSGRGTFIVDPDGVLRGIEVTSGAQGRNSAELIRKIEGLQFMRENPSAACPAKWTPGAKTLTPSIKIAGEVYEALNG